MDRTELRARLTRMASASKGNPDPLAPVLLEWIEELESDCAAMADYLGTLLDVKTFAYDEGKHNKALEVARKYKK